LEQVYSRGLGAHFVTGTNHQTVVERAFAASSRRADRAVVRVSRPRLITPDAAITTIAPLKPGDGVVFDAADWRSPQEREEGGRVYTSRQRGGALELRFGNGAINFSRIRPGDLLWRSTTPTWTRLARPFSTPPRRCTPARQRARAPATKARRSSSPGRWRSTPMCAPQCSRMSHSLRRATRGLLPTSPPSNSGGWATRPTASPPSTWMCRAPVCAQLAAQSPAPPGRRALAGAAGSAALRARSRCTIHAPRSWRSSEFTCRRRCLPQHPSTLRPALHLLVRTPTNSTRRWRCARPASRSTIWNCTGCARRWSRCRRRRSPRAWPARACSSPTSSASSTFCCGWLHDPGALRRAAAGAARDEDAATHRRLQPERGQCADRRHLSWRWA
jgi:hypothetical protein